MSASPVGGVAVVPAFLSWTDDAGAPQQFHCFVRSEDYDFEADITEHPVETGSNITDNVRLKTDEATVFFVESDSPIGDNNWTTVAPGTQIIHVPKGSKDLTVAGPAPMPLPATFEAWNNLLAERGLAGAAGGVLGGLAGAAGAAVGTLVGEAAVGDGVPVELPFPPGQGAPPSLQTKLPSSYTLQGVLQATANSNGLSLTQADGTPITLTAYTALTIALLRKLQSDVQVVDLIAPYLEIDGMVIRKIHIHRDADTGRAAEIEVSLKQIRFVTTETVPAPAPSLPRASAAVNSGEVGPTTGLPKNQESALITIADTDPDPVNRANALRALGL